MSRVNQCLTALLLVCAGLSGCGGSQTPAESPGSSEAPAADPAAPAPAPPPAETTEPGAPARPQLTAEACEAGGGTVVGDIGDGAIHRVGYRCPSGAPPTGSIRAPEGGPMGVEGSVCCPK